MLFADVVGSTALGHVLDPEDVQEVVGTAVARLVRIVEHHGGSVREIAGDGVLAVFSPHDGVDPAVEAGSDIVSFAAAYGRRLSEERHLDGFGVRVGIHAGEFRIAGSPPREHVSGPAVTIATALEAAADPCTVLISDSTVRRLARPRTWDGIRTVDTPTVVVDAHVYRPLCDEPRWSAEDGFGPSELPSATGPREERKVVTAVFVRAQPSDAAHVEAPLGMRALDRAEAVIERYGGLVKDRAGGGLAALFGVPQAHEDDAERAVRAGLELVAPGRSHGLQLYVGITTGLVVLGQAAGGGSDAYSATGDTMNTAARLHAAAEPGTVLTGERTYRLVAHRFDWGPASELRLKGKPRPIRAYPALGVATGGVSRRAHTVRFVGREQEHRRLRRFATDGRGLLVIEGEAGLGKSRLVAELEDLWRDRGTRLISRCSSFPSDDPYEPLRALLGAALRERPDERPNTGAVDVITRTAAAMADHLRELATPVLAVVEDVHFARAGAVRVLLSLMRMLEDAPVLLVVTRRPHPGHPSRSLADLAALSGDLVELGPLDDAEQRELLTATVGVGVLPIEVEDRILEASSGNPFFLEELVGALRDRDQLVRGPGGWSFEGDPNVDLPDTVERVLLERIDQLDHGPRSLLDAAAVVGREFTPDVVGLVVGTDAQLEAALGELVDTELVQPLPGEHAYTFRHSLVAETAYNRLLRRHRRTLHRRVAEILTSRGADDGVLARHWWRGGDAVAAFEHARRAGAQALELSDPERAVDHFALAVAASGHLELDAPDLLDLLATVGEAARVAGRLDEAMGWLERAGTLAERLDDDIRLAQVAVAYEDATYASRRVRSGPDDAAMRLLDSAAERLSGQDPMSLPVDARRARALLFSGDEHRGRELVEGTVAKARAAGEAGALAHALLAWRMARQGPEHLDARLAVIDETVRAADTAGEPELALEAARLRVVDHLERGDIGAFDRAVDEVTARIEELQQPHYLWYPAMWRATRLLLVGDLQAAEEAVARFHEIGRRLRFGGVDGVHALQLFLLRREQGRADEVVELSTRLAAEIGAPWLPAAAAIAAEIGDVPETRRLIELLTGPRQDELPRDLAYGTRLAMTAEAVLIADDGAAAEHLYRELLPYEGRTIVVGSGGACLGASSHYLGALARLLGDRHTARRHLEDALEQNLAVGALPAAGYTACELAEVVVDPRRSGDLVRRARHLAEELGLSRLRDRALVTYRQADDEETEHARTRSGT